MGRPGWVPRQASFFTVAKCYKEPQNFCRCSASQPNSTASGTLIGWDCMPSFKAEGGLRGQHGPMTGALPDRRAQRRERTHSYSERKGADEHPPAIRLESIALRLERD
eukprot:1158552-Pelagomonas_calceolata.AAC.4